VPQIKTSRDHPASMAERIARRLDNSGAGANPDQTASHGSGPTRTHTNLHQSARHTMPSNTRERGEDFVSGKGGRR
jgi:hypothetical protein